MKIIAYFLPQFHEIEENNLWWGEGFTEWTNMKKSTPLYKGHYQPRKPLDENYYNLLKKNTVKWQTDLSKEFGIDGFCYYHYWFNGRKILEKPAENLLKWKEINQNFCFCWANHSWRRTWNGTNEILIEQTYGNEIEWEEHFNYLLTFFREERYLKEGNKPIFMIFAPNDIPFFDERIKYYNKRAVEEGFEGLYIIESKSYLNEKICSDTSNAVALREPTIAMDSLSFFEKFLYRVARRLKKNKYLPVPRFDAKKMYKYSINALNNYNTSKDVVVGAFYEWDSTPRHKRRGYVIENNQITDFYNYLISLKQYLKKNNGKYLFFNAWNEWCEGMYLEPDEKNGTKILKVIKKAKQ